MHQVALTRFKRALPRVRRHVRELTHTLHLPPAQSELYDGPHPEWLRDVLEQLPNLQCLVVSQIPFFDHSALLALKCPSASRPTQLDEDIPSFPLRLLIAAKCPNSTSAGLREAMLHFPYLVFLDLSETYSARDETVLSSLKWMHSLQVLKLRRMFLRDSDLAIVADAVGIHDRAGVRRGQGIRLRSLDVRDNQLTDASVRTLLAKCFHPTKNIHEEQRQLSRLGVEEDWSSGAVASEARVIDQFRGEDLDEQFIRGLTRAVTHTTPSEDLPSVGLTHLYIANNYITIEGLSSLLRTENLHVLDAGALDTAKALRRPKSPSSIPPTLANILPGAEKLIHVLERYAADNLTFLKLNHAVVTASAGSEDDAIAELAILDSVSAPEIGHAELHGESAAMPELHGETSENAPHELDAAVPSYELATTAPLPRYELPGDPIQIVISPAIDKAFPRDLPPPPPLDSPASAPEVMGNEPDEPIVLTATGLSTSAQLINGIPSPPATSSPDSSLPRSGTPSSIGSEDLEDAVKPTKLRIDRVIGRRQALRYVARDPKRGVLPSRLPALRTLILTEVPMFTTSEQLIENLKAFIADCALEHHLATKQASLEGQRSPVHILLPSTRKGNRAAELFALRTLILEMAPQRSRGPAISTTMVSPRSPKSSTSATWAQKHKNWSSTEDPDTERFWSAAENDFSFFGDEECGLPASDADTHFPISLLGEKVPVPQDGEDEMGPSSLLLAPQLPTQPAEVPIPARERLLDVVAELAKWRAERKREFENAGRQGFVEGYWPGEVRGVRRGLIGDKGRLDWYGNYFEKGVYR